jgi:hypothetical protein
LSPTEEDSLNVFVVWNFHGRNDKLYTVLVRIDDPEFVAGINQYGQLMARKWDEPEDLEDEGQSFKKKC